MGTRTIVSPWRGRPSPTKSPGARTSATTDEFEEPYDLASYDDRLDLSGCGERGIGLGSWCGEEIKGERGACLIDRRGLGLGVAGGVDVGEEAVEKAVET